jgi:hypothetical protein
MRAGAGRSVAEMERVDVEIQPWVDEQMRRELEMRQEEEDRVREEEKIGMKGKKRTRMKRTPRGRMHEECRARALDEERRREIYGDDPSGMSMDYMTTHPRSSHRPVLEVMCVEDTTSHCSLLSGTTSSSYPG